MKKNKQREEGNKENQMEDRTGEAAYTDGGKANAQESFRETPENNTGKRTEEGSVQGREITKIPAKMPRNLTYNTDSRVHYARRVARLSKEELAHMARTTVRTIERWEKLERVPERALGLWDLSCALHLDPSYFTDEDVDPSVLSVDFTQAMEDRKAHEEEMAAFSRSLMALRKTAREINALVDVLERYHQEILKWEQGHIMDL